MQILLMNHQSSDRRRSCSYLNIRNPWGIGNERSTPTRSKRSSLVQPGVVEKVAEIEALIKQKVAELDALPIDAELAKAEPDDLPSILKLRPSGSRRVWSSLPADFRDRLEGSWLGRCAGCTLGSIVEGWDVERMERWAEYLGDEYPLVDYWSQAEQPSPNQI